MLSAIRDRATGVIAWVVVILLIIPFAFWGIQSYFGGGGSVNVADINGTKISKEQLTAQVQRALQGDKNPPEGAAADKFSHAVLEQMIQKEVLAQAMHDAGFRISDAYLAAAIRHIPAFQRGGKFDQKQYVRLLYSNSFTEQGFEAAQRRQLLLDQLAAGVARTEFALPGEVATAIKLRNRTLQLSYAVVPVARFMSGVQVSDAAISSYYDQHHARFMRPEQVKLRYIKVDQDALAAKVVIPKGKLAAMYQRQKDSFTSPERRSAAHILIVVSSDADAKTVAAAKAKAEKVYKQITAGEAFAVAAKKYSDDAGSADSGGKLGFIDKGTLGAKFDEALYGLKKVGDVAPPVRLAQGFDIIKLTGIQPARQKTFAEVRDVLASQYRQQQAENEYYDISQRMQDASEENPLSLEPTAKKLGFKVEETGWITRKGGKTGLAKYPPIVQAAFSYDVLAGGSLKDSVNSRMIELNKGDYGVAGNVAFIIHAAAYQPARLRPLKEVRDEIIDTLRAQAAQKQASKLGRKLIAELRSGKDLAVLAKANGLKVVDPGYVSRDDKNGNSVVIDAAFQMQKPKPKHPTYGGTQLPSGDYAVVAVTGVKDGDPAKTPAPLHEAFSQGLVRLFGALDMHDVSQGLRQRAEVKIYNKNIGQNGDG